MSTASSRAWLRRQATDAYVRDARRAGYRSRSAFKLLEMDEKLDVFRGRVRTVVDLGAAPGGWTQVAASRVGAGGVVVAVDLLPMEPVHADGVAVHVLCGDMASPDTHARVRDALGGAAPQLVMCDAAPNATGDAQRDHWLQMRLARTALDVAVALRAKRFLVKAYAGDEDVAFVRSVEAMARVRRDPAPQREPQRESQREPRVVRVKPAASRSESREFYVFAELSGSARSDGGGPSTTPTPPPT